MSLWLEKRVEQKEHFSVGWDKCDCGWQPNFEAHMLALGIKDFKINAVINSNVWTIIFLIGHRWIPRSREI